MRRRFGEISLLYTCSLKRQHSSFSSNEKRPVLQGDIEYVNLIGTALSVSQNKTKSERNNDFLPNKDD